MSEQITWKCNGPDCAVEVSPPDRTYGRWIVVEWPEPMTPYWNTQYGLVMDIWKLHFHEPESLQRWVAAKVHFKDAREPAQEAR